jgi:hypothetical protein
MSLSRARVCARGLCAVDNALRYAVLSCRGGGLVVMQCAAHGGLVVMQCAVRMFRAARDAMRGQVRCELVGGAMLLTMG